MKLWFSRMCKIIHITPKYIHVKVNGNNLGSVNAKHAAKWKRKKKKKKKKQKLKEQLHKIHVECDVNEC